MCLNRCISAAAAFFALSALTAYADKPHIYQHPALSQNLIAFAYAGDLWTVPRDGGRATRLTAGVGIETAPVFSPDGQTIAFTGEYDGNVDVFVMPASGGVPRRLTHHPGQDEAVGWTPDGKRVLFVSSRAVSIAMPWHPRRTGDGTCPTPATASRRSTELWLQ